MIENLPVVGVDLPDVPECYGHVRRVNGIPEPDPFTSCPQCDGRHHHEWVDCLVVYGHGERSDLAHRCDICGGRRCDVDCMERRHHRGPHMSPTGELRPVGK